MVKDKSKRIIQRERFGIDFDPPPQLSVKRPADLIMGIFKKAGLKDKMWEQELIRDWGNIVGETVAEHSRPGRYMRGTLTIFIDSSPWLSELQCNRHADIMRNLQERFGEIKIKNLIFQIDPDG